jgi:hypothetical protein
VHDEEAMKKKMKLDEKESITTKCESNHTEENQKNPTNATLANSLGLN